MQVGTITKVNGSKAKNTEWEPLNSLAETSMKVNGATTRSTEWEFSSTHQGPVMMENGEMMFLMDKER